MNHRIKHTICAIGLAAVLAAGCTKKIDPEETELNLSRLLSPTAITTTVTGTSVLVSWKAVNKAQTYDLELFANGTQDFSGTPVKSVKDLKMDQLPYTLSGLYGETNYSIRVKAKGAEIPESIWTGAVFKSGAEQIMQRISRTDLTQTSVRLTWTAPNDVSHFMIGSTRYDISATEKAAGSKTLTGLTNGTQYTVKLYFNDGVRGNRTFKTYTANPTGANVVTIASATDLNLLATAAVGTTFIIPGGAVYDLSTAITLPANASITIWGEDGPVRPVLALNGLTLPATAGTIKFANVDLTGYPENKTTNAKRNYIFNQSAASVTTAIIFDNCIVRNFVNTPVRLQGANAITIDKVVFNNCIVYDIGDNATNGTYALINNTNTGNGKINNIEFTQSTFYSIGYALILHNLAPSASVKIENCTIDNATGNGRFMIDYNTQTVTSFTIKNTIIGKTLSPAATANGIRAGTVPVVTNSYKTKDAFFAASPIPAIVSYDNNNTVLFTDPANGNFLIKDNTFGGALTTGDPRWQP